MPEERLQKLMAAAGLGSRRSCETMISAGRVTVNGQKVIELGAKADPRVDKIVVDGQPLKRAKNHVYYKIYKPRDMLSDIGGDARGRATVADLLPEGAPRVFPVGRLDLNSEGLMLLTDDGALANRLTHPRYQHPKIYYALVEERPSEQAIWRLRKGVKLPEGRSAPAYVKHIPRPPDELLLDSGRTEGAWLQIVLREGKKRQIRHMTAAVGSPTLRLIRWAIGPLTLAKMTASTCVPLTRREVSALQRVAAGVGSIRSRNQDQDEDQKKPKPRRPKRKPPRNDWRR